MIHKEEELMVQMKMFIIISLMPFRRNSSIIDNIFIYDLYVYRIKDKDMKIIFLATIIPYT